jgi:hypothetical protein
MSIFRGHAIPIRAGYLEKCDCIFRAMGRSLRVGETVSA